MKKHFYLFAVMMLASTLFMAAPAKAATVNPTNTNNQSLIGDILGLLGLGGSSSSGSNSGSGSNCPPSTQLPINSNIVFLMVAGVAIGVTTLGKNKLRTAALKA